MKKLFCLVLVIGLTGCCTYQKNYDIDNGVKKEEVDKKYKKCLASEFIATLKFWIGMRGVEW